MSNNKSSLKLDNIIKIKNLNSIILNKEILKDINLQINKGSKIALLEYREVVNLLFEPFL